MSAFRRTSTALSTTRPQAAAADMLATVHASYYPLWPASRPKPSGPTLPPAYTPVWVTDVAAAVVSGLNRTTAVASSPGQHQPSTTPSRTPGSSAPGASTASRPTPIAAAASEPATSPR